MIKTRQWWTVTSRQAIQPALFVAVYDVTEDNALTAISEWIEFVKKMGGDINVPGVLIANKTDLTDLRVVTPKAGMDLANTHGLHYLETSVVSNHRPLAQNNNASTQFIGNNCSIFSLFSFFFSYSERRQRRRGALFPPGKRVVQALSREGRRIQNVHGQLMTKPKLQRTSRRMTKNALLWDRLAVQFPSK